MLNIPIFADINENDMLSLLRCLDIKTKSYKKGVDIIKFKSKITAVGIVLTGSVDVIKSDINGDTYRLRKLGENGIFAEDLVCSQVKESPINVVATSNCEVLFVPYEKLIAPCQKACPYHIRLVKNVLKVIADNNINLMLQFDLLGKRTIREKLLTYLRTKSHEAGTEKFEIKLNRNELAEFICVDRSAMCRELGNMRDDGLIQFEKNHFTLL
ncbi:MAG: Crp/Fnr family transcriptional regulator [Candidatus Gastranaerophilales bacterium]|nr:Crp/Fnr family transcriptional regulator [Candidatus Gastranaerophilales bacterium]